MTTDNPDPLEGACKHETLGFASGGFYVQCADCSRMWVALKPDRVNDAEVDPVAAYARLSMHDARKSAAIIAQHYATVIAENERLIARVAELEKRGSAVVIAYHMAICSPKGVVPVDELYDAKLAAGITRKMEAPGAKP